MTNTESDISEAERGVYLRSSKKKKEKIFNAKLTHDGWLCLSCLALPLAVSIWIGVAGLQNGAAYGTVLLLLAGFALTAVVAFLADQLSKSIRVTPEYLVLEQRSTRITMAWAEMKKFKLPPDFQKHFRVARISDGAREIRIDSMIFEEFDLLISLISVARKTRAAVKDDTYEL